MIAHCHRWLLATAAAYLALQPTNAATYARSVMFGLASLFGLLLLVAGATGRDERIPSPGTALLLTLGAWCIWDFASVNWSLHPDYTLGELRREILFGLMMMAAVYIAARDARAWHTLVAAALGSFGLLAALAVGLGSSPVGWDAGRWHVGVGAFSTYLVLVAPLLITLLAPPPAGFGASRTTLLFGLLLLALMLATARLSENRMVWVALAVTFATAAGLAAFRWRAALGRASVRWLAALVLLLVVLGGMFAETALEKAKAHFPPETTIAETFVRDPRILLWETTIERIEARPWRGYGFGKSILEHELRDELHVPEFTHAHNIFVSQWLQTGAIGFAAFVALMGALVWRYLGFFRARDDALAVFGIIGVALVVGFLVKNLTDDFLLRSNGKEFWMLNAALLGVGVRRMQGLRAGGAGVVPPAGRGWRIAMRIETVIINCSTREQTTLALVSAIRHARLPVTVIDCESTDGSRAFFTLLQSRLAFALAAMPLRRHGDTLDRIFADTPCDALLLLDSDAEILRDDLVPSMQAALAADTYGSGFLHPGQWLGSDHRVLRRIGYFAPRMWIPCVLLKVAPVRAALARGLTFRAAFVGNELAGWPRLARLMCQRFRVPGLRSLDLGALRPHRGTRFGVQPHYFYYDTGALLHQHLQDDRHLSLAHLGDELWASAVRHHHGVTRKRLKPGMKNAADVEATRRDAVTRIEAEYGVAVPELR